MMPLVHVPPDYADLPGADLVDKGLSDLRAGCISQEALLVLIGAPRLRSLGIVVPPSTIDNPEHALWHELGRQVGNPHSAFNALRRRLVSFQRALGRRVVLTNRGPVRDSTPSRLTSGLPLEVPEVADEAFKAE